MSSVITISQPPTVPGSNPGLESPSKITFAPMDPDMDPDDLNVDVDIGKQSLPRCGAERSPGERAGFKCLPVVNQCYDGVQYLLRKHGILLRMQNLGSLDLSVKLLRAEYFQRTCSR